LTENTKEKKMGATPFLLSVLSLLLCQLGSGFKCSADKELRPL